jgi:2-hydroxychromene-2-carboxylate isomerase
VSAKSRAIGALLNTYLSSRPAKHALYDVGRVLRGGKRRARLYYRADDPYSHLLAQVAPRLKAVYGITVEIIPVAPPGLEANPAPEMLRDHAIRDAAILAERHGLSFPADATHPPDDRVRRAHAVLLEPRSADEQVSIAIELGEAVWRQDGQTLADIVERHGGISGESVRPALAANYDALERAGHYQPGMLQYGGDWYWGVDRLCHLEARFHREGVEGSLGLRTDPSPLLASAVPVPSPNPLQIELFFSFRSPYSYVALPQLMALRDRYGIAVRVRPVLPMVMRGLQVPRSKRLYIALDAKREADRLGIPFGHVCDPLGKGIGHCMALFFRCIEGSSDELDRLSSIAKGIWAEARDVAHLPDLVYLADRAGIPEADVRAAIEDRAWKDKARANRDALTALGLWGVPSLRIGGYTTWGQDRIAALEGEIARVSPAV